MALTAPQLAALAAIGENRISVRALGTAGQFKVAASSWVGDIAIPELRLRIRPKVRLGPTLMHMLARTGRLPEWHEGSVELPPVEGLLDYMAWLFAIRVEAIASRGLYKTYRQKDANLPYVRGRIVVPRQARRNAVLKHRVFCDFTEHTADVDENQALRATLDVLLHQAYETREVLPRLRRLLNYFEGVRLVRFTAEHVEGLKLNRLNTHYSGALSLSAFILRHLTVDQGEGDNAPFPSFLIDMNSLYEEYLTRVLQETVQASGLAVRAQEGHHLDEGRLIRVVPDLVFYHGNDPVLVADIKYKEPPDGLPKEADLYQIAAYSRMLGVDRAALIYAGVVPRPMLLPSLRYGAVQVDVLQFDLGGSRADLEMRGQALGDQIIQLVS
ncbi:MAG: McrC family protein [Symbiobacteriia bacterium]